MKSDITLEVKKEQDEEFIEVGEVEDIAYTVPAEKAPEFVVKKGKKGADC